MRKGIVALGITVLLVGSGAPAEGQFSFDARRLGMGGVQLGRGGTLVRYNPAYQAVLPREGAGSSPKLTIPIPLGLIAFFSDHPIGDIFNGNDPLFNPDSAGFNPIEIANLVFHAPLYLEVKEVIPPVNDVEFTIGRNVLIMDFGNTQRVIPADEFGLGGSNRLLDFGVGIKGVRVGVTGWMHYDVGFRLDSNLLAVLKQADSVRPNTTYRILSDGIAQAGIAPTIGYAGRITGDSTTGLYIGANLRYYLGGGYGSSDGSAGFQTSNPIFDDSLRPNILANGVGRYSSFGNSLGKGVGGDVGVVWVSGPLELGLGVNDIGATLTWKDTRIDSLAYFNSPTAGVDDSIITVMLANHVETTTKLPVSYVANFAYTVGSVTFGGTMLNAGRGTSVQLGVEKRFAILAVRGGVNRDQRKRMQFGFGGGVRLGPVGLDVGFFTHSTALSDERGITMATSLAIY